MKSEEEKITTERDSTGRETVNLNIIPYEQAIFLLDYIMRILFLSIETLSDNDHINTSDKLLNSYFLVLSQKIRSLLSRKDMTELKDKLPKDIPENLEKIKEWLVESDGKYKILSFKSNVSEALENTGNKYYNLPYDFSKDIDSLYNTVTEQKEDKNKRLEYVFKKTLKENEQNTELKYITKDKNGNFHYKGNCLNLSKNPDWYKVFSILYGLIHEGGEITYTKLGNQIKSMIKKTKNYNIKRMRKFIQTNLTDKSNGFMHYANISEYEENGRPLLRINRGKGVIFNNKP